MWKQTLPLALVGLLSACASTSIEAPPPAGGAATGGSSNAGTATGGSSSAGMATGGTSSGGSATGGASSGGSGGASGGQSSMADVQAIFDSRCVLCHDKAKHGLPTFPQLSLVASDAHAALVNKAATETCGGILVVPGNPDRSYLIHKLTQATPCDGLQMPRPFEIIKSPPLSADQVAVIRSWISSGAQP